jgi:signal transduction histidine kinase
LLGGSVVLSVRDHGPGIDPARRHAIFDRFERATTSRNISGLGLGLFIVKKIVESHGGTIAPEDSDGPGTTFVVRLPVRAPAQPEYGANPE